jgi:group I intron endonuclease
MIDIMKRTGVYKLYYIGSDKFYIGSAATSFIQRLRTHLSDFRSGRHHNEPLMRGYKKYGESMLVMEPIVICPPDLCIENEIACIVEMSPSYNASQVSNTRLGCKASDDTRKKISEAVKGRKLTEEHKQNISLGLKGKKKISEEHKAKMREYMTGRKLSESTKEKVRLANLGKKQSKETKEKRSRSMSRCVNTNKYSFIHKDGRVEYETCFEMKKKYGTGAHIHAVVYGKKKSAKGWRLNRF